jgi:hypothetical protein
MARSAMTYLLYYTQYMQICQTTCFCYCISKTKNEFGQNPEENICFRIWTGPDQYNVFFRILSELVFRLRYTITKTCRLTDLHVLSIMFQIVHGTSGQMTVYGPVCHPQNSMWTSASLPSK